MGKRNKPLKNAKSGEVIPADKPRVLAPPPVSLTGIKEIRAEMARVYRMIFRNEIYPEDATKLVFMLDKMVQAVKSEVEMAQLQNQYIGAWSGVAITAPAGAAPLLAARPHAEIIPPEKQSEETEE
jgi:hypothetical protein